MKSKFFLLALLLMVTTAGVWAQLGMTDWESPQSQSTSGRYRSYADDFMRPDAYSGVKFNKWMGIVSFDSTITASAGIATKIKDLYIGAFYSGNFWTGSPKNDYTETNGKKYYNAAPSVATGPVNNVGVLIGAANMGFRLAIKTNYQRFDEDNFYVGTSTLYKNYHAEDGYLIPQLAWSMAKDMTKSGIRPYLVFDLPIYRNNLKTEISGSSVATIGNSTNHVDPKFRLGLGGYALYNKNSFKLTADLDYDLNFAVYNNEYNYYDGVLKIGKIKGTYNGSSLTELFNISNTLTPSLAGAWSKDRVALKFKLNLPLALTNGKNNTMGLYGSSQSLVQNGASNSTTYFGFTPDLRLAMQYKIIPDRLTLNVGSRLQVSTIGVATEKTTSYTSGTEVANSLVKTHKNVYGNDTYFGTKFGTNFNTGFNIGASFNFSENVWTEFNAGVSTDSSGKRSIKVFDSDGLFAFGSILFGLKF